MQGSLVASDLASDSLKRPTTNSTSKESAGGKCVIRKQAPDSRPQQRGSGGGCVVQRQAPNSRPVLEVFLVYKNGRFVLAVDEFPTHYGVLAIECKGKECTSPDLYVNIDGYTYELHKM